jgi:hypothetical protein
MSIIEQSKSTVQEVNGVKHGPTNVDRCFLGSSLAVTLQLDNNPYSSLIDCTNIAQISRESDTYLSVRPLHLVHLPLHVLIRRKRVFD